MTTKVTCPGCKRYGTKKHMRIEKNLTSAILKWEQKKTLKYWRLVEKAAQAYCKRRSK